jgi:hypothetical protein
LIGSSLYPQAISLLLPASSCKVKQALAAIHLPCGRRGKSLGVGASM